MFKLSHAFRATFAALIMVEYPTPALMVFTVWAKSKRAFALVCILTSEDHRQRLATSGLACREPAVYANAIY